MIARVWLLLVVSFFAVSFAQSDPIRISLQVEALNSQGQWVEATTARPGTTVRYTLTATNEGATTLPAGTVVIVGPVAQGVTFVDEQPVSSYEVLVEYGVAGDRFVSEMPSPEQVGSVRWTVLEPFEPDASTQFRYLVQVDGDAPIVTPPTPPASGSASGDPLAELAECARISNDIARLECFDGFVATYGITGIASSPSSPSSPPASSSTSSSSGFEIVSSGSRRSRTDRLEVYGEVRNVSNQAQGVELEIVIRDARGALLDSISFWPASTNNIPPGGTRGFDWSFDIGSEATSFDVQVVSTTTW